MLKIGHSVQVPRTLRGPDPDAEPETIPIPEELETVPGSHQDQETVTFYSRNYPIENHLVEQLAYHLWSRDITDIKEIEDEHWKLNEHLVKRAQVSGDVEPTREVAPGKDLTQEIKDRALELGFGMVGITAYDNRYTYKSKKKWIKPYAHAVCMAMEQDYETAQMIPSPPSEKEVYATYRREGAAALELADYIRSLGYHAQIQDTVGGSSAVLPMFVEAGLGQMGAMGYLLSPHFGSRVRLILLTTDAPVTHDQPVDYGINAFCNVCQVCVNRCPGRALMREKVWWRGVEKFKVIVKRCRPVMARYSACGVCMKVCPVQRYGLKPVMEHYASTGQVLGKGTHNLEGYDMGGLGYFGPGQLPSFDTEFFHIPEGSLDERLFQDLKSRIATGEIPQGPAGEEAFRQFGDQLVEAVNGPKDLVEAEYQEVAKSEG